MQAQVIHVHISMETTIEGSSKLTDGEVKALAASEANQKMIGSR